MSNKVLSRAFAKLALQQDKQAAIITADSAQVCVAENCREMQELTPAESKELKEWMDLINSDL